MKPCRVGVDFRIENVNQFNIGIIFQGMEVVEFIFDVALTLNPKLWLTQGEGESVYTMKSNMDIDLSILKTPNSISILIHEKFQNNGIYGRAQNRDRRTHFGGRRGSPFKTLTKKI